MKVGTQPSATCASHQPRAGRAPTLPSAEQLGMDQVDGADVERRRHGTRPPPAPALDEVEADLAVIEAAVDMGAVMSRGAGRRPPRQRRQAAMAKAAAGPWSPRRRAVSVSSRWIMRTRRSKPAGHSMGEEGKGASISSRPIDPSCNRLAQAPCELQRGTDERMLLGDQYLPE